MTHEELIQRFSDTPVRQGRAVFSMLFILTNRLQTLFDSRIPAVTLKQFMLLSILHQAGTPQTLTELGVLLGCSRQNVKKLAEILQRKGFVAVIRHPRDPRAVALETTERTDRFLGKISGNTRKSSRRCFQCIQLTNWPHCSGCCPGCLKGSTAWLHRVVGKR